MKYELVTVESYLNSLEVSCTSVSEKEIEKQVEKYLSNLKRYENNAKVIEALLA